jgi:hypothetical protein
VSLAAPARFSLSKADLDHCASDLSSCFLAVVVGDGCLGGIVEKAGYLLASLFN